MLTAECERDALQAHPAGKCQMKSLISEQNPEKPDGRKPTTEANKAKKEADQLSQKRGEITGCRLRRVRHRPFAWQKRVVPKRP